MDRTVSRNAIHEELAQTIAVRQQLFGKYSSSFASASKRNDVHAQLQHTIRAHKAAMHQLYLKIQTTNSKQAA